LAKTTGTSRKPVKAKAKPAAKKPVAKTIPAKAKKAAAPVKKAAAPTPAKSTKPTPKPSSALAPVATSSGAKPGKKGIDVVSPKVAPKRPAPKQKMASVTPPTIGRLLDPSKPLFRKPLIPSGPKAVVQRPLGAHGHEEAEAPPVALKTPFGKKELSAFRQLLLRKRAELVGDIAQMEREALQGGGSLSSMPQHMAEQGSDTYDTTLSLDLAAADRKLIKEIDDAIARIDKGTYGVCELTGKPIKVDRLEELPWARYSIEAARELERRSMRAS